MADATKMQEATLLILNGASGTGKTTTAEALSARVGSVNWIHPDGFLDTPNMKPEKVLAISLEQASRNPESPLTVIDCQIRPTALPAICAAASVRSWLTVLHTCPRDVREARLLRRGWDTVLFDRVAAWSDVLLEESLATGALVVDTSIEKTEAICDRIIAHVRSNMPPSLSNISIRPATPDQADVIASIYVTSWNEGFGARMPHIKADPARVERWRSDLGPATPTRWWIAARSATILGFVGIGPCRDPVQPGLGELDTIAVSPYAWHAGVGKALMATALEGLRRDGYESAALWTLNRYPLGERFYIATGWHLNGDTRNNTNQVRYDHDLR